VDNVSQANCTPKCKHGGPKIVISLKRSVCIEFALLRLGRIQVIDCTNLIALVFGCYEGIDYGSSLD